MIAEISDIERAGGCRCAARKFEPCRCARTVGMCAGTGNITPYDRGDSRCACVNSTDGMGSSVSNVERITDLGDAEWAIKTRRGAGTVRTARYGGATRECGHMPRLGLRRRRGRIRRRLFRVRRWRNRLPSIRGSRTTARWICIASPRRRTGDEQQRYRQYGEQRPGGP